MPEKYYCPRCASPFKQETSFCRTCGLALKGVSEIVSGDAENAPVASTRPNFNAIRIGIGLVILATVFGLANVVIKDLDLFPTVVGKAIVMGFMIAGMLSLGFAFVFPSTRYTKRNGRSGDEVFSLIEKLEGTVEDLDTTELKGALPPVVASTHRNIFQKDARPKINVEPGSIAEHTTRNLS
ncbi:MAG: hypothetical protein ACRD6X_12315 [Pyrinomonadaceae bacterium]